MTAKILPRLKQLNAELDAKYFAEPSKRESEEKNKKIRRRIMAGAAIGGGLLVGGIPGALAGGGGYYIGKKANAFAADDEDDDKKKKSGLKTAIGTAAAIGGGILAHKAIMGKFGTARSGAVAPVGEAYKNAGRFASEKIGAGLTAAKTAVGRGIAAGQGAGDIIKRGLGSALKAAKNKVVPAAALGTGAGVTARLRALNAVIDANYFAADDEDKKKKGGLLKDLVGGAAIGLGGSMLYGAAKRRGYNSHPVEQIARRKANIVTGLNLKRGLKASTSGGLIEGGKIGWKAALRGVEVRNRLQKQAVAAIS